MPNSSITTEERGRIELPWRSSRQPQLSKLAPCHSVISPWRSWGGSNAHSRSLGLTRFRGGRACQMPNSSGGGP